MVVVGATGGIGRGVVEAALAAGHRVVAVAPDNDELSRLASDLRSTGTVRTLAGSIDDDERGSRLASSLRALRQRLVAVVIAVNAPVRSGRLLDREVDEVMATIRANALVHLVAARQLIPLLSETCGGALFIGVCSGAADFPWAGYGEVSVAASALKMLMRVLADEVVGSPVRVRLLQVNSMVRTHKNAGCACESWPSAVEIGRCVVEQIRKYDSGNPIVHFNSAPAEPSR